MTSAERKQRACDEIDLRMHDFVFDVLSHKGEWERTQILGYLRAAYAQGYTDCYKEPEEKRGIWYKQLGYG